MKKVRREIMKKSLSLTTLLLSLSLIFCPTFTYAADEIPQETTAPVVSVEKVLNVKAKATGCSSVKITWNKAKKCNGYELYRYNKNSKKYRKIKTIKTSKTTRYVNTGLKSNTTFYYKVKAYKITNGEKYTGELSKSARVKTKKKITNEWRRNHLVETAKSRIGCPYVYGASGPKAFDCSGLVYWSYKNSGVKTKKTIKRTSCAGLYSSLKKYKVGSSLSCAKPGDIILFKRGGRWSHAAIYYKNKTMIHAPRPGKRVCVVKSSVWNGSGTRVAAVIRVI